MTFFRKIVGERCYLSPLNTGDAFKVAEWNNDLEIAVGTGNVGELISVEGTVEYINHLNHNGYGFLIVDNKLDQPIGMCKLTKVDLIHRNATVGITIGEKDYWNKGFGTEALNLLLDFGFNILNLNNIMLKVFSFNKRAIHMYKKCGFREIGRRRQCVIFGNEIYDDVYMDMLAEEFHSQLVNSAIKCGNNKEGANVRE